MICGARKLYPYSCGEARRRFHICGRKPKHKGKHACMKCWIMDIAYRWGRKA